MTSSFSWMAYSEHERQRMLDVVSLFNEQDTRDELGIGSIRDAFADLLFPGTGTVQTRARYFLFIPWIYLDLERKRIPSNEIAVKARRAEIALITPLAKSHKERGEGVIGISARESLSRLPSNIYWLGLGVWGIRRFQGSQEKYHRYLDQYYYLQRTRIKAEDGEPISGTATNWHTGIPLPPSSFPDKASFELPRKEAEYLRELIMSHLPGSLLAFLVDTQSVVNDVAFPWQHPQFARFPLLIQEQLKHGQYFSEILYGAALLYNLMLAENSDRSDLRRAYKERVKDWAENIASRRTVFSRWDRKKFWQIVRSGNPRIAHPTQLFVDRWIDLVISSNNLIELRKSNPARELIHSRERTLKRGLARLDNQRALEMWNGAAGTSQLDYRWRQAKTIVGDILEGLGRKPSHA